MPRTPAPHLAPPLAPPPAARYSSGMLFRGVWAGYLRPHVWIMALAGVFMVIEGATLGALSWLIEPLFDQVFAPGGQDALIWVGLAILALFLIRAVTSVLGKTLLTTVAQKSSTAMQVDLLAHLLRLDGRFFQENAPGALIERVQGDTIAVQGVWSSVITGVGRDAVALVSLFVVALSIDPWWTLAALVGAPLLILPALAVQRYIRRKTAQMRAQAGLRATRLDEIFHGVQAIKLNRIEAYQVGRFRRIVANIVRAEIKTMAGRATIPALIDIITKEVSAGGAVTLPGVGKIYCRERPQRTVRNPATGESITKPADKVVKMTIAKALKDSVNG